MNNQDIWGELDNYAAISVKEVDRVFTRCDICHQYNDCYTADYLERNWQSDMKFMIAAMLTNLELSNDRSFLMDERLIDICHHCLMVHEYGPNEGLW